jgi:hypothetical protein
VIRVVHHTNRFQTKQNKQTKMKQSTVAEAVWRDATGFDQSTKVKKIAMLSMLSLFGLVCLSISNQLRMCTTLFSLLPYEYSKVKYTPTSNDAWTFEW